MISFGHNVYIHISAGIVKRGLLLFFAETFTLLALLNRLGETGIGDLSEALAIDGTTLTRNLEMLVRRGLVENIEANDGHG